jgi:hypothetical protein
MADGLYANKTCRLCGKECLHGAARENHARKHQREGWARIKGFGGPDGRRYELTDAAVSLLARADSRG